MNEQEVAVKLTEVEARCKSNTHRLDNVEKRQNALDNVPCRYTYEETDEPIEEAEE